MRWTVETLRTVRNVEARDQWEAYDALRDLPAEEFGLLVTASERKDGGRSPR